MEVRCPPLVMVYEVEEALEAGKDPQQAMDDVARKRDEITAQSGIDIQKAD